MRRRCRLQDCARSAALAAPSGFAYVDLGSGQGPHRVFVAAELPFREVIGVDLSRLLHDRADAPTSPTAHAVAGGGPFGR